MKIEQNSCVTVKFNAILGVLVLAIYANWAKNITRLSIISRCKVITKTVRFFWPTL